MRHDSHTRWPLQQGSSTNLEVERLWLLEHDRQLGVFREYRRVSAVARKQPREACDGGAMHSTLTTLPSRSGLLGAAYFLVVTHGTHEDCRASLGLQITQVEADVHEGLKQASRRHPARLLRHVVVVVRPLRGGVGALTPGFLGIRCRWCEASRPGPGGEVGASAKGTTRELCIACAL